MEKIIVASDSFKGSLSSRAVGEAVSAGIHAIFPHCLVQILDTADGGEGTVDSIVHSLGGEFINIEVADPLGRPLNTYYGILSDDGGKTAVIEMAKASGLALLAENERNPLHTSSYGTGQLILDALERGCRRFFIGIGGSATNDGGTGMLNALGFRFFDSHSHELQGTGSALHEIVRIDSSQVPSQLFSCDIQVACDVDTLFYGEQGATKVFSPQKGADSATIDLLESGMVSFAGIVKETLGKDMEQVPGSGAAGGLGGALWAFLNARLESGIDFVLDALEFDKKLEGTDLVITGEGCIDEQTAKGKTPYGVLKRAALHHIPVIALGGCVRPSACDSGFLSVFPILPAPASLDQAMDAGFTKENLTRTIVQIMRLIRQFEK